MNRNQVICNTKLRFILVLVVLFIYSIQIKKSIISEKIVDDNAIDGNYLTFHRT
jgi:hypothetical protein